MTDQPTRSYDPAQFGTTNKLKWVLIRKAPFSASGLNELIGAFVSKKEAFEFRVRHNSGQYNTAAFFVCKLDELRWADDSQGDS